MPYKNREDKHEWMRRFRASAKGREYEKSRAARRIRIKAGGIEVHVGTAPTLEAAHYLREKIKREAPRV